MKLGKVEIGKRKPGSDLILNLKLKLARAQARELRTNTGLIAVNNGAASDL